MTELEAAVAAALPEHLEPLLLRLTDLEARLRASDELLRIAAVNGHLGPAAAAVAAAATEQPPPFVASDYDGCD